MSFFSFNLLSILFFCTNVVFVKMPHDHVIFFFNINLILLEMMQVNHLFLENMMNIC